MKVALDTNALDWILLDPRGSQLLDAFGDGRLVAVVAADNAYEIHRIPEVKAEKRERLQALLARSFHPLAPTHVPISGIARCGLARVATPRALELRERLMAIGIHALDSNHLINASCESCTAFVTLDKGILNKREALQELLGLECLTPALLLEDGGEAARRSPSGSPTAPTS